MTAVARDQFKIQGLIVRHIPTGAVFTRGSRSINWGRAGVRLPNGEQYVRREIMRTALAILGEVVDTPVTRHQEVPRRLVRRPSPTTGIGGPAADAHPEPAASATPLADASSTEAPPAKRPSDWRWNRRQVLIVLLCGAAFVISATEISSYASAWGLLSSYVDPAPLGALPITRLPCCGDWYVPH
jgi:hypothetical protein